MDMFLARDTCLSRVNMCLLLILLLGELPGSLMGQSREEIWPDMWHMSVICWHMSIAISISIWTKEDNPDMRFASEGGGDLQGLAHHAHDLPQKMIITVKLCAFYVYF